MNGTNCCLPRPPCGAILCELVESATACARSAERQQGWCPDPLRCRRLSWREEHVVDLPTWKTVYRDFIAIPMAIQASMLVIWPILGRLYAVVNQWPNFRRLVRSHIGCLDQPVPSDPFYMQVLTVMQMIASLEAVAVFVFNCYAMKILPVVRILSVLFGIFHMVHYFVISFIYEFKFKKLFSSWQLVDVLTVPGMLFMPLREDFGQYWLTLNFLRSLQALFAYERLDKLGGLRTGMGEVASELVVMALRFLVLVVCFASFIFILEVLGEIPFGKETLLPTGMGDISFFIMLYWVIETISTVGYGDFAPTTFLSRLTTMAFMIAGVAFFSTELNSITTIAARQKRGTGEFQKTSRPHVVLLGGGVRYVDSALVLAFLDELYHRSYRNSWPDVCVMSIRSSVDQLTEAVESHLDIAAQQRITYLVGSPLKVNDLKRCRCEVALMVVILADTTGHLDPYQEDKLNILRTMSLHTGFPRTPLRLMLLMSESKEKAISVGIREQRILTVNDLRSGILAGSCRCVGLNTLLSNLIVTTDNVELSEEELTQKPWLQNYLSGMDHEMYGLLAAEEFYGEPYQKFVVEAYVRNEVCVFAAQIKGSIVLAPFPSEHRIDEKVVFFALAQTEDSFIDIAQPQVNWGEIFAKNRWKLFEEDDARRRKAGPSKVPKEDGTLKFRLGGAEQHAKRSSTANSSDNSHFLQKMLSRSATSRKSEFSKFSGSSYAEASMSASMASSSFQPSNMRGKKVRAFGSTHIERADMLRLGMRVQEIRQEATTSPFVLLLDLSASWLQVAPFVRRNREKGLPFQMPIVVLCQSPPSRAFIDENSLLEDHDFAAVIGNPVCAQDLLRAGVEECSVIVCLGLNIDPALVEGGTDGTEMLDADVVMLQRMLELLGEDGKHVILEFKRAQNMRLLPKPGEGSVGTVWKPMSHADAEYNAEEDTSAWLPTWLQFRKGKTASSQEMQGEECEYSMERRFACGQIFAPNVIGSLVACEYRMPGMIEMAQMLVTPSPDSGGLQTGTFLWQIRVKKEHRAAMYGEVFQWLVTKCSEPALPLGILRRFADSRRQGYVWTNPGRDVKIDESDLIFVLGTSRFGKLAYDQGLLPFSGRDPASRVDTPQSSPEPTPRYSPRAPLL